MYDYLKRNDVQKNIIEGNINLWRSTVCFNVSLLFFFAGSINRAFCLFVSYCSIRKYHMWKSKRFYEVSMKQWKKNSIRCYTKIYKYIYTPQGDGFVYHLTLLNAFLLSSVLFICSVIIFVKRVSASVYIIKIYIAYAHGSDFSQHREESEKKRVKNYIKYVVGFFLCVDFSLCEFQKKSYLWDRCCIL